jgi:hypothetical protein
MLTLFAIPKAFRGHIAVIQRNAIGSWARLGKGSCEMLLGDEEGTAEVARELHLEHLPEIARNEFGTPLVSGLFERAHARTAHDDVLCYVNSDFILLSDFPRAIERVRERTRRSLVVGACWDLDLRTPVPFDDASRVLTARRLRRQLGAWARLSDRSEAWQAELSDRLGTIFWRAAEATCPLRHRFGLRAATFRRIWPW